MSKVGTHGGYLPLQMCYPDLWVTLPVGDPDSCSPLVEPEHKPNCPPSQVLN